MKGGLFVIAMLAIVAVASAIQVSLYSNTEECGNPFGSIVCETIYNITNNESSPIVLNTNNTLVFYRSSSHPDLSEDLEYVGNTTLTVIVANVTINQSDYTIPIGESNLISVRNTRIWRPTGIQFEEISESTDNVLSIDGINYTEFAWWNNSYLYRKVINITSNNLVNVTPFILNLSFDSSSLISAGKMLSNCNDLRFTYVNETTGLESKINYFLYADIGYFGNTQGRCSGGNNPALIFVRVPLLMNNSLNALYMYYGNSVSASESNPNATLNFHDYPQGSAMNLSNWALNCPAGTTCDVTSNYDRMQLDAGTPAIRVISNVTFYTSTFWQAWKTILFMGSSGGHQAGDYQQACTTGSTASCTNGYDLYASGINSATWKMVRMNYNSTRAWCYINEGVCSNVMGTPNSVAPTTFGFEVANTPGEVMRVTNVSVVNWLPNYPTTNFGAEGTNSSGALTVTAFDENTNQQIYFNATFTNGTSTYSFPTTLLNSNSSVNFPQGTNTVTFQNASYYLRTAIVTISNSTTAIIGYLLPLSNTNVLFVRFHALSPTLVPIAGATFTFSRDIVGVLTTVGSCITDSTGVCAAYLDSTQSYSITAAAGGFNSQSQNIMPVGNDYTFTLSVSSEIIYPESYANLSFSIFPFLLNLPQNWTVINFTVISTDNALSSWGLNISYNGALLFNQTNFTSNGGSVLVNVSFVGREGNLTATGWFQKTGKSIIYYSQKYTIYGNAVINAGSLETLMASVRTGGKSPFIIGFLIILITATIIGGLNKMLVIGAGVGLITAFMLVFFAGFLLPLGVDAPEWGFLGLLVFLGAAMLKIRSGA